MMERPDPTAAGRDAHALRLGNIVYSNCFPVHAGLIDRRRSGDPELVDGLPSQLNSLLRKGEIDLAPSSSIEYARNADRYAILPDLVIGAYGPVRSILFISDRDPRTLEAQRVALPTASATSVVLLKILLRSRWGVRPEFEWFDQEAEDPFQRGAAAALFIGDVALRPGLHADRKVRFDLGSEWWDETGLPFAFAVWQARDPDDPRLPAAHQRLLESRDCGRRERARLARDYADHFGMGAVELERYWNTLTYELDDRVIEGLRTYYRLAREIGEVEQAPQLRWAGV